MANKDFDESEGVWRTVGGRRIFIRTGQSLSDAMKASGKFKRKPTQKEEQHNLGQNYAKSIAKGKELDEKAKERLLDELRNKSVKEIQDAIDEDPFSDEAKIAKEYMKNNFPYYEESLKNKNINPRTGKPINKLGQADPANTEVVDLDKVGSSKRNETKKEDNISKAEKEALEKGYSQEDIDKMKKAVEGLNNMSQEEKDKEMAEFKEKEKAFWNKYDNMTKEEKQELLKEFNSLRNKGEEKNNLERIGEKEPANKAADDLVNKFWEKKSKVNDEKQFNKKVELNQDLNNYMKENGLTLENDGNEYKLYKDGKQISYLAVDENLSKDVKNGKFLYENQIGKNDNISSNDKELRASMGDVDIPDNFKSQFEDYAKARETKERLERELKQAETDFVKHYDKSDFNNEDWRKKSDELLNARMQKQEEFNKAFQDYVSKEDEKNLSWQDRVRKNDLQREEDLKSIDPRYHSKEYYGKFKEYEEKNAKIKEANAKPEDLYEPISSYYSFNEKRHEFAGDKMDSDGSVIEWGDKKFTGKGYTNDEFMEHLEDANWHTERRMLETAGLTNQELSYIKDRTTLDSYGVGKELTGRENTQKMIDEAKAHFAKQASSKSPFESKRVAENEIAEKGYKYYSTHGASLGTIPSDVNVADTKTHEGGWTSFKTDRPLTTEELKRYDIQDESRNAALDKRFGVEPKIPTKEWNYADTIDGQLANKGLFASAEQTKNLQSKANNVTNQYMNDKIRSSKTKSAGSSDIRTRWAGTLKDLTANGMSEADALEFIKKYLQK